MNVTRSLARVSSLALSAFLALPGDDAERQGAVSGTVFDSLAMRPLAGAHVQLALPGQMPVSTSTAEDGVFHFGDLAPGRYLLSFSHPTLDSLGLEASPSTVRVDDGDTATVRLAVPSARSIAHLLCPANRETPGLSTLVGFVRSAGDGAPVGASTVTVRFDDYVVSRRRVQRDSMGRTVVTKGDGYFVACGIPADVTVLARAVSESDTSGYLELELPPNAFLKRDLYVGKRFAVSAPVDSTQRADGRRYVVQVLRGSGVLTGSVVQSGGKPIAGARVSVWGTGREVVSNDAGRFTLDSLPTGSQMVEVRALGYVFQRSAVDLRGSGPTEAAFELTGRQMFLDTVRVLATRAYVTGRIAEFEGRRRSRIGGYFLDQDEIDRRRAATFTDLMRAVPTVIIDPDPRNGDQVRMIGASNENDPYCDPTVWIDGSRQPQRESTLNAILFPERIVAIEVYSRTVESPPQYQHGSRCGVILVWTGERVRRGIADVKR